MRLLTQAVDFQKLLKDESLSSWRARDYAEEVRGLAVTIARESSVLSRDCVEDAEILINLANAHVYVLHTLETADLPPTPENIAVTNSTKVAVESALTAIEGWMEDHGFVLEDEMGGVTMSTAVH